uniref:Ubiquitin family protein n=1 Tax=Solanum tuberosum TaxID=4113 RepID=M1BU11_SOLTU
MDEIEEKKMVEIFLKIIGPSPPCRLNVPSSIKVHELRKMIAGNRHMPIENLRLVLRGNVLHDSENGDDEVVQFNNGDSLIVAVKPKPPPRHFRDEFEDDDDDELRFQLPPSTSKWKRKLFYLLRDKLKFPGEALTSCFHFFYR